MDFVWSVVRGNSVTFTVAAMPWRLSIDDELKLEYLGRSHFFCRIFIFVKNGKSFSFHRHFPSDGCVSVKTNATSIGVKIALDEGEKNAGMINVGDTSHVSALVQTLFYITALRSELFESATRTNLENAIADAFAGLQKEAVAPSPALIVAKSHDFREYFRYVVDELKTEIFTGEFFVSLEKACGCKATRTELFNDVVVEAKENLVASLEIRATERMECDHGIGEAMKRLKIKTLPDFLVLNVKRSDEKATHFEYPHVLSGGAMAELCIDKVEDYRLYSVINSDGDHKFCYVSVDGKWVKFNDCVVTRLNDFEVADGPYRVVCLFYLKQSQWDKMLFGDEGLLTRIITNRKTQLATGDRTEDGIVTMIFRPTTLVSEGLFYFTMEDMPRFTALTLFSNEYPSAGLHAIKKNFVYEIKTKLWSRKKPRFSYLFRVTEHVTEYLSDNDVVVDDGFLFYLGVDSLLEIDAGTKRENEPNFVCINDAPIKRLYFLKMYKKNVRYCTDVFPENLEIVDYVLLSDKDFDFVDYYKIDGDNVTLVDKKIDGECNAILRGYEVVVEGIYVILATDHRAYVEFRDWVRRRIYLNGMLLERRVKVCELEDAIRRVLMSNNVSVDWKRSRIKYENERGSFLNAVDKLCSYEESKERSISCVEKIFVDISDPYRLAYVAQGADNYNKICHIHPVVIKSGDTVKDLVQLLKYYNLECVDLKQSLVYSKKDTFVVEKLDLSEEIPVGLIVLQDLRGEHTKVVFTKNLEPKGYPFYLRTEGLSTLGDVRDKYKINALVIRKIVEVFVIMEDDDKLGEEMLLVEVE